MESSPKIDLFFLVKRLRTKFDKTISHKIYPEHSFSGSNLKNCETFFVKISPSHSRTKTIFLGTVLIASYFTIYFKKRLAGIVYSIQHTLWLVGIAAVSVVVIAKTGMNMKSILPVSVGHKKKRLPVNCLGFYYWNRLERTH